MSYADYKIAYVSRETYPNPNASSLQTLNMVAALTHYAGSVYLFVHELADSEASICEKYGVGESGLRFWSLKLNRWPSSLRATSFLRAVLYNTQIAFLLNAHRRWRRSPGSRPVLFVRSRLEGLYWGLMRPYLWPMRDWLFVYEVHDIGLPLNKDNTGYDGESKRGQRTIKALKNYDLVLAKTAVMAADLQAMTKDAVKPIVFPNGSALRRDSPPNVELKPDKVLLGYVGTVDLSHGVEVLITALRHLPDSWRLRLVGRVSLDRQSWIETQLRDPALAGRVEYCSPVGYGEVTRHIDECDILLVPAGDTTLSNRYRSPLKIFDYMARGKPIVATRVPAHLELLTEGVNAVMFEPGNFVDLAAQIKALVEQPEQAQRIAHTAWELSAQYTYDGRAQNLLQLIDAAWKQKHQSKG
jgi:glycosyltransferase involved in cell wall biosynthesis